MKPSAAAAAHPLADGVVALPAGFVLLARSHVLLIADAHFGYEDVMAGGAALPLWSTAEMTATIERVARHEGAREIVFLGDVIHGSGMSEGAMRSVVAALDRLRAVATVTCIAGNHEGRSRGAAVLGATVERCEREGWLLVHGDKPEPFAGRSIIGHLHPSVHLGGATSAPAFLASSQLIVVPALTPYSVGLDVLSDACGSALEPWNVRRRDVQVVAAAGDRVYPFGSLSLLRGALRGPQPRPDRGYKRRSRLDPS